MAVTMWLRWSACTVVLALGLCAARAQTMTVPAAPPWQEEWLSRFNQERARIGAPPLRLLPVLTRVAQQQAEEMAARRLRSPSTATVSERLRRAGYSARDWRLDYAVATLSPQTGRVDWSWSPGPRAALGKHLRNVGIGAASINGGTFYVFLFGLHEGDYFAGVTGRLDDRARIAAEMLSRVNDIRRQSGLPALALNPLLDRLSQAQAEDMLVRSYYAHQSPEGLGPSDRARAAGYRAGIGENIAEQRFSVDDVLKAWLDSPGHRRNILDPGCREMGLGLAVGAGYDAAPGGYRVVWVQSFGRGE
ncbi:MAG TPA: CAP domain-containing protein [Thermoanaerobaculia bacterium]|nr:CAP domain-containing protein [Thermoanaerobaculia bacterium]